MEKNIFVILVLCAVFSGCRTLTVKENMPERWENTYSGMTLEAFKQVWPDSKWAGETSDGKAVYMARSPLVAPPSFGFDYFLFDGGRFLSSGFFLYTPHGLGGTENYETQMFSRKPYRAGIVETSGVEN